MPDLVNSSVLEVRMKLVSDDPQLLMVVERKGAIRHMSGDLAKVLGVRRGGSSRGSGMLGQHADEADQHQVCVCGCCCPAASLVLALCQSCSRRRVGMYLEVDNLPAIISFQHCEYALSRCHSINSSPGCARSWPYCRSWNIRELASSAKCNGRFTHLYGTSEPSK